ncbi:MAG: (5-formylfuran-3-yl)methyl phosphate synthase [Hyphomicrobiaceae bacterium]
MTSTFFTPPSNAHSGHVQLLASVMNAAEAAISVRGGADVVDAKDPRQGALGALDSAILRAIRAAVPPTLALSATTGDIPVHETERIVNEMLRVREAGADLVKIGFFASAGSDGACNALLERLRSLKGVQAAFGFRVAVLLADQAPDWKIIDRLLQAGFCGVMLDTADKASGSLFDIATCNELQSFVHRAHRAGLFAGLAGALRLRHIHDIKVIGPDVAGFRGALCKAADRTGKIDEDAVGAIRSALTASTLAGSTLAAARPTV